MLRDLRTGAIINTNASEYEDYIRMKKTKETEIRKFSALENEVVSLKNDLNEIKDLLRVILNASR